MIKTETPPSLLYKYRPFNVNTLAGLVQKHLWFSSPENFNDPFDGYLWLPKADDINALDEALINPDSKHHDSVKKAMANEDTLAAVTIIKMPTSNQHETIEQQVKRRGVFCANVDRDNILMWSHYADQHHGLCIGYRLNYEALKSYADVNKVRPQPSDDIPAITDEELSDEALAVDALLTRKSRLWSYENEWRLILKEPLPEHKKGCERTIDGQIEEIIFGMRMPDVHKKVIEQLFRASDVSLKQARPAYRRYAIHIRDYMSSQAQ